MPVPLVRLDQHHIANCNGVFAVFVGNDPFAVGDHENLFSRVRVPPVACAVREGDRRHTLQGRVLLVHDSLAKHNTLEHVWVVLRCTLTLVDSGDSNHANSPRIM